MKIKGGGGGEGRELKMDIIGLVSTMSGGSEEGLLVIRELGRETMKVEPSPTVDSTRILPWCISTILRAIERPNPAKKKNK